MTIAIDAVASAVDIMETSGVHIRFIPVKVCTSIMDSTTVVPKSSSDGKCVPNKGHGDSISVKPPLTRVTGIKNTKAAFV